MSHDLGDAIVSPVRFIERQSPLKLMNIARRKIKDDASHHCAGRIPDQCAGQIAGVFIDSIPI